MIFLYNLLLHIGALLAFPVLLPTLLRTRKRRDTVLQRLGFTPWEVHDSGDRSRIWVHALSVGEVISSVPLVKALRKAFPHRAIYFSASTLSGFETAQREFKGEVSAIFYFPYDFIFAVRRTIRRVDPAVLVIVETDLWPSILWEMKRRGIPVMLVNTRLSKNSFAGYRRFRFFFRPVFEVFTRICTQTRTDALRFRKLGISGGKITITGNIKFDNPVEALSAPEIQNLRRKWSIGPDRRIWVAGSTHDGEEVILLKAFAGLERFRENLCLIVAPRNPDRAGSVCEIAREMGLSAAALTDIETHSSETARQVLVVDRIGLLKRLYGLAEVAFVGGSLVKIGGHNLLEPAAHGKPVLFGPHAFSFSEISNLLLAGGGAVQVSDGTALKQAVEYLLSNPTQARDMGARARKVFEDNRGSVERTLAVIREYLRA